jgi:hypothetical protein
MNTVVDRAFLTRLVRFEYALTLFFERLPVDVDLTEVLSPAEVALRFFQACADAGLHDNGTIELLRLGPLARQRLVQTGLKQVVDHGFSPDHCRKLVKTYEWPAEHPALWQWVLGCVDPASIPPDDPVAPGACLGARFSLIPGQATGDKAQAAR